MVAVVGVGPFGGRRVTRGEAEKVISLSNPHLRHASIQLSGYAIN